MLSEDLHSGGPCSVVLVEVLALALAMLVLALALGIILAGLPEALVARLIIPFANALRRTFLVWRLWTEGPHLVHEVGLLAALEDLRLAAQPALTSQRASERRGPAHIFSGRPRRSCLWWPSVDIQKILERKLRGP